MKFTLSALAMVAITAFTANASAATEALATPKPFLTKNKPATEEKEAATLPTYDLIMEWGDGASVSGSRGTAIGIRAKASDRSLAVGLDSRATKSAVALGTESCADSRGSR
ncbi:hypothetical protein QNH14_21820 [Apirhabdus apintestini]|nr:hypothetical protein QNH14_21820 [Enterobacteriaceae bacterium CA-0114]